MVRNYLALSLDGIKCCSLYKLKPQVCSMFRCLNQVNHKYLWPVQQWLERSFGYSRRPWSPPSPSCYLSYNHKHTSQTFVVNGWFRMLWWRYDMTGNVRKTFQQATAYMEKEWENLVQLQLLQMPTNTNWTRQGKLKWTWMSLPCSNLLMAKAISQNNCSNLMQATLLCHLWPK